MSIFADDFMYKKVNEKGKKWEALCNQLQKSMHFSKVDRFVFAFSNAHRKETFQVIINSACCIPHLTFPPTLV